MNGSLSPAADTDDSGGSHSTSSSDSDFIIPELPSGSKMDLNIHSTWGDRHYLGLNGIEVFSNTGEPVSVVKVICHITNTVCMILKWQNSLDVEVIRVCRVIFFIHQIISIAHKMKLINPDLLNFVVNN
jgi:hypothetical protein